MQELLSMLKALKSVEKRIEGGMLCVLMYRLSSNNLLSMQGASVSKVRRLERL